MLFYYLPIVSLPVEDTDRFNVLGQMTELGYSPATQREGDASDLQLTRTEYNHTDRCYYSVDGYPLRDGLRAAIGEHG